jgi:ABC-type sugar transport system substrate-binding protein
MRKSLKMILVTVLSAALMWMIAACGSGNETGGKDTSNTSSNNAAGNSGGSEKGFKIGFAVPDQSHPLFVYILDALKKLIEEQGGELLVANAAGDVNKQINNIENLIASKVQVLIVCPQEPKGVESAIQKAKDAGIKTMLWGNDDLKNVDVIQSASNKAIGIAIGEHVSKWINEKLGGKAEVGLIVSTVTPGLAERSAAFEETIKKNSPNVKFVAKQEALPVADSQKVAENMLTANPNMQVIATVEDSQGLGAYEAVKAAGRAKGDFYINGIGATPEALAKIKEGGVFRATLDMESATMAQRLADTAVKMAKGEPVEKLQYAKLTVVDSSNLSMFMK